MFFKGLGFVLETNYIIYIKSKQKIILKFEIFLVLKVDIYLSIN